MINWFRKKYINARYFKYTDLFSENNSYFKVENNNLYSLSQDSEWVLESERCGYVSIKSLEQDENVVEISEEDMLWIIIK